MLASDAPASDDVQGLSKTEGAAPRNRYQWQLRGAAPRHLVSKRTYWTVREPDGGDFHHSSPHAPLFVSRSITTSTARGIAAATLYVNASEKL